MFKLIIADDEGLVRKGLKNEVSWSDYNIRIAGEARDGIEALRLATELNPDIIITDIRMPNMDGLEFIKRIHEINKGIKIIILSGYDDFAVAKEALKHGVLDFLLKPTDMDELDRVIRKAVTVIEEERVRSRRELENYFYELVDENDENLGDEQENENEPLLGWNVGNFCVAVIEPDNISDMTSINAKNERFIVIKREVDTVRQYVGIHLAESIVFVKNNQIVVIFNVPHGVCEAERARPVKELCRGMKNELEYRLNLAVAIGIGREYSNVNFIKKSYEEARVALNYKGNSSQEHIISVEEIEPQDYKVYELYAEKIKNIEIYFKLRNAKKVSEQLAELFAGIAGCSWISIETVKMIASYLLMSLCKFMFEAGMQKRDVYVKEGIFRAELDMLNSMDRIESWTQELFRNTLQIIIQQEEKNVKVSIVEITKYVEENFDRDISLSDIGDNFCITSEYVSALFKKEKGENYILFLSKLRIERAKEMLADTDFKVYEIAEKVGYYDTHHFSKVFRKFTGTSPSEYRNKIKSS